MERELNLIDHKVTLLTAAGVAMTGGCHRCLDEIMPELEQAGVSEADIQWAMQNGQFAGPQAELGSRALEQVCDAARDREYTQSGK